MTLDITDFSPKYIGTKHTEEYNLSKFKKKGLQISQEAIYLTSRYYYNQTGVLNLPSKTSALELHTDRQRKISIKQTGKDGHSDEASVRVNPIMQISQTMNKGAFLVDL